MRRTDINEEGGTDANQGTSLSGSGRRLDSVIPFPRRADPPSGFAAEVSPPEASAPFESLGSVTQAVVMRLANDAVRLRVLRVAREEDDPER
jgi:hypothetical protein